MNDDETVSFLGMADVSEDGTTSVGEDRPYSEVRKGFTPFMNGDLLIAKITPCFQNGKIVQADVAREYGFGSTEFHVVRTGEDLDPRYLLHYLRRPSIRIDGERRMTGSGGQRRVPTEYVKNLQLPLPPIEDQRRIAAILDHADALRAKRREALARLDELTQAIFIDMFGDPALNTRDWPVYRLTDVLVRPLQNGAYFAKENYADDGTEMVHMGDVFYDVVERGNLRRVGCAPEDIEKYGLGVGDLLVARRSLNHSGAAKPCLVPNCDDPLLFESSLIRATPDPTKATVNYLFHLLSNQRYRRARIHPIVTGATISGVSQTNLAALEVPVPPLVEQFRMNEAMEAVDQLRARDLSAQAGLDTLFASLQSRAFRGEL